MENASQAFIIAASVLIGLIILSMAIYLSSTMGQYVANAQTKIDRNQVDQFNEKFLKYEGLTDLTIQDIISVKNYALENNKQFVGYNVDEDRASENNDYIDVYYGKTKDRASLILNISDEQLLKEEVELQKENTDTEDIEKGYNRFTCELEINTNTGKVNRVYFYET